MTNILPINKFINISLRQPSLGLKQPNLSDVIIFTDLQYANGDVFRAYQDATAMAEDFGTSSEVYKQGVAIFSQVPNILANGGTVIVAPLLNGVLNPETAGYFVTGVINAAAFTDVSDGAFDIAIDGEEAVNVTGLDFSKCYTITDIIGVLNAYFTTNELGATASEDAGKIVITSATAGATSSIALTTPATGTNLLSSLYFSESECVAVQGVDASTGQESLLNAIIRLEPLVNFHGILFAYNATDEEILDASNYVQTKIKMLFVTKHQQAAIEDSGLFDIIRNRTNTNTRTFTYLGESDAVSRVAASAYTSRTLSVNFEGSNTSSTNQAKELYGIDPDPGITLTLSNQAQKVGAAYYANFTGKIPAIYESGENDFTDNVYNYHWIITAIQVAAFNALRQSGTKIPQTEDGVAVIVDAIRNVCKQGVINGVIAPGTWTREVPFGNQELFKQNIETYGYYIYSEPLANQSQADREARKCPLIQIGIKFAGAIHSVDIIAYINK